MPCRHCGLCRMHYMLTTECVPAWVSPSKSHSDRDGVFTTVWTWVLPPLRTRIAFSSESDSAPRALPFLPPRDLWRKNSRARGLSIWLWASSGRPKSHVPRHLPSREDSPILFEHSDQRPSADASDMFFVRCYGGWTIRWQHVSNSISREGFVGLYYWPRPLAVCRSQRHQAREDAKLFSVLYKAVEELGLEWSTPEEPTRSRLESEVHSPLQPCRMTSALAGRAYSSARQAASALHSMAVLQVFQAKLLQVMDESRPDPAAFKELRSATDLALRATKATAQAIGRSNATCG